jgi:hypothetical protein
MIVAREEEFEGYPSVRLANEVVTLWVTRSIGPRILGLSVNGGENLFAVLPNDTFEHPGGETFYFRGGHRLWAAPEDAVITYAPDNAPVEIHQTESGLAVEQSDPAGSRLLKKINISLPEPKTARIIVDHEITNQGKNSITLAPWAITQFRPGGVGILPQPNGPIDQYGMLPNRQLAIWPYTDIANPKVTWGQGYIYVQASFTEGAFKVGFPNPHGWLGYWFDGTLFMKQAEYHPDETYFDHGSSSECYCNPRFLELETIGPRVTLEPGAAKCHREVWRVFQDVELPESESAFKEWINKLDAIEGTR